MKRIGLIGGTSWQSTIAYYRLLNTFVQDSLGGHASAPVTIHSVNFAEIEVLQQAGDWHAQGEILAAAARALQAGGAQAVAVAANTLHLVSEQISSAVDVPFIDLIDVAAKHCAAAGFANVGLLATAYTMDSYLYPNQLAAQGVSTLLPVDEDRALVHRVIYDELTRGVVTAESRTAYLAVVDRLVERGADAVLLGCTEIDLLIHDGDAPVPLVDTTRLHARALTDFILSDIEGS